MVGLPPVDPTSTLRLHGPPCAYTVHLQANVGGQALFGQISDSPANQLVGCQVGTSPSQTSTRLHHLGSAGFAKHLESLGNFLVLVWKVRGPGGHELSKQGPGNSQETPGVSQNPPTPNVGIVSVTGPPALTCPKIIKKPSKPLNVNDWIPEGLVQDTHKVQISYKEPAGTSGHGSHTIATQ